MMLRTEPTAEDSLALILARSRFGIAIAAMIRMIATTISNSISEKPFCLRISFLPFSVFSLDLVGASDSYLALGCPERDYRDRNAGTTAFSVVKGRLGNALLPGREANESLCYQIVTGERQIVS